MGNASRKPRIAVVGAGIAGLRCAAVLLEKGNFEVTIIEGRDRIGGRVQQAKLPTGHFVDCGPNWIHGTEDNPILDIATEEKVPYSRWDENSYIYDEDGKLLPQTVGDNCSTMMWEIIQDAFAHSNAHSSTISPEVSLWDFFQQEVVKRIPETKPDFESKRRYILQMAEMWGAFVGSPVHTQSLKFFWLEECIEGENLFCAGTYQKILQSIAKPAIEKGHIKYSTVVTNVNTTSRDGGGLQVAVATGEILEFDEVVFTSPLGWLKQHPEAFSPALPTRLSKAINSIGYGCLEKVYISFREAFWLQKDSRGRTVTGFCQWLSPSYATNSNPKKWNQEIVELGSLPDGTGHPTLLFYIYGDQSRHITSELLKLTSAEKREAFLYDFFKPYYSRLPHYNASSPGCQPVASFSTDWVHDHLAGNGSYSNFQVGLEEGDRDIEAMREGLPDQGLWFAGEHTAPFVALGTATGAYWSGENVGKRIMAAYGSQRKDNLVVTG
ncbi:flavin-containing amine oxidoreductase [Truncatella angustata]|uniref:Flavin-containing amine oxidoreductase n=1 Tax=Truncatella angustata TaxID=152316 RepID=A0A9P8UIK8_9PEZI|nr:flavin-containing amine oxidoreductase [Truncatella angustata]KAH6652885.1 flavin-containing amine oxidoreductase [Truncatella angustata]